MNSTSFVRSRQPCCLSSGDSDQRSSGRCWRCQQFIYLDLRGLIASGASSTVRFVDVIVWSFLQGSWPSAYLVNQPGSWRSGMRLRHLHQTGLGLLVCLQWRSRFALGCCSSGSAAHQAFPNCQVPTYSAHYLPLPVRFGQDYASHCGPPAPPASVGLPCPRWRS